MKLTNKHSYVKHLHTYKNSEIVRRRAGYPFVTTVTPQESTG